MQFPPWKKTQRYNSILKTTTTVGGTLLQRVPKCELRYPGYIHWGTVEYHMACSSQLSSWYAKSQKKDFVCKISEKSHMVLMRSRTVLAWQARKKRLCGTLQHSCGCKAALKSLATITLLQERQPLTETNPSVISCQLFKHYQVIKQSSNTCRAFEFH